ncbi:MAG: hypothetical protein HN916_02355 [Anaerolineae bacterium]|nr:hypothetical protein [Anaerolineae bacterium]
MSRKSLFKFVGLVFVLLFLAGCEGATQVSAPTIENDGTEKAIYLIVGIAEAVNSKGVLVQVEGARVQQEYSVHYIMYYAPDSYSFYKVILSIDGEMDEPHETLAWGEENIRLTDGESFADLEHAVRILVGDNIVYKAGEDFEYRCAYFFKVPKNTDHTRYKLILPGTQEIPLVSIVEISQSNLVEFQTENNSNAFIGGGEENIASGIDSFVGGGKRNAATAIYTAIGGGQLNTASVAFSTIGGGVKNSTENVYSTVGGGYANLTTGQFSTIGGGSRNTANFHHSTVGGGIQNIANASDVTIAGGAYNVASDPHATIGGGTQNMASGTGATISGGAGNNTEANHSSIGGGLGNEIAGNYAVISGGRGNLALGAYSVIPGGLANQAQSDYSFASGYRSIIANEHPGTFLFADSVDADFFSENANEFAVRATGGVRFISAVDAAGIPLSGVFLPSGSGSWSTLSDENSKEKFVDIDEKEILDLVVNLPISEWSYISEESSVRHMGPMAQDFYSAFGLGVDERYISSVDSDGVALVAIQALNQLLEEKDVQIRKQNALLDALEGRIAELEKEERMASAFPLWIILGILIVYHLYFVKTLAKNKGK